MSSPGNAAAPESSSAAGSAAATCVSTAPLPPPSSAACEGRAARLAAAFAELPAPRAFGHEVAPGLLLANLHALRDVHWLAAVRAEAVIVVAAELGAAGGPHEVLPALRARAEPPLAAVHFYPVEEARADHSSGGGGGGGGSARRLGVTAAYTAALRRQLVEAADAAAAHLAAGRRTVVACRYGYNRSASAVLCLLMRHRALPLLYGLEALRAVRAKVYPNIETYAALLEVEAEALGGNSLTEEELLLHHAWAPARRAAVA